MTRTGHLQDRFITLDFFLLHVIVDILPLRLKTPYGCLEKCVQEQVTDRFQIHSRHLTLLFCRE